MVEERVQRRLAAILAADVVGYSRLMGEDEEATLATLKSHRDIIDGLIADHKGRVFGGAGDSVIAEFASPVEAVRCATEIQLEIDKRNAELPEERRMRFRVGVHLGDVMAEGDDLYGDGVNVAARLEGLAEPGGICISQQAFDQVETKLDLAYEDLGEQQVKNIARPVRAYRVLPELKAPLEPKTTRKRCGLSASQIVGSAVIVVLVIAGLALGWWQPWKPDVEPASVERMAFPLPDTPSIAVLPFANMSDDPGQEYFADGIAEDLITDLSKISGLFVIARNSAFTYKGRTVKVRQVAEDLGVRYVLEGSVRRVGDQVRINAQLIDATTGGHLWAERYDGSLADVFALQDKVTRRIVKALAVELTPQEAQRVGRVGTDNVAAHDVYLLGLSFYYRRTPEDNAKAAGLFKEAIKLDPNYSAAYTALAKAYEEAIGTNFGMALGIYWRDALAEALRLLEKGKAQPNAGFHVVLSRFAVRKRQHALAIAEAERALELSPNDADALDAAAEALIYAGQPREGIEFAQQALRQNPTLLGRPLYLMGLAEFALGHPDKAVELLERARELAPENAEFAGILAAAYGELGLTEQAKAAYDVFRRSFKATPELAWAMVVHPFSDRGTLDRLADGFRVAFRVPAALDHGYLPLHPGNKLSGPEIKSLLVGRKISGLDFWNSQPWLQQRTDDGTVMHSGFPIHAGIGADTGISRIEDDMLCETWPELTTAFPLCFVVFRVPAGHARDRWGDYVMVTEQGPQPFRLIE